MSRNRKQQSTHTQAQGNNSLPVPGTLTLSLGPKGVHISGPGIQPERMTFKPRQPQQGQQQSWSPNSGGGGSAITSAMQNCLLAATAAAQIQQQQFTLHQQAQANSQMLITALTQVASSMGVGTVAGSGKKQRQYRAPQQQFAGQQKQAKAQNQQRQSQQQRQPQYA